MIAKAILAAAVILAALGAVTGAATSSRVPERQRIEPVAVSANGSRAFFATKQRLIRTDRDQTGDLYEWRRGRLILLSAPSTGQPSGDANIAGGKVSSDGRFAYFVTGDPLVPADNDDGREDVYLAAFGSLRLVSGPTDCAQTIPCSGPAFLSGISADGSHAFFESFERLAPEDTDNRPDLYDFDRRSARLSLVSYGPAGGNAPDAGFSHYAGSSADGRHVFFTTPEPLAPEDTDGSGADLYRRSGGQTSLVSTGPGGSGPGFVSALAVSGDGTRAVFFTRDPLLPADDDGGSNDIYLRAGGTTTLVSDGAGPDDSGRLGRVEVSEDARRILFETTQRLASRDRDRELDVYRWRLGGSAELTPTGSGRGNAPLGTRLEGISANGRHAFLATAERLVRDDRDRGRDLYRWLGGRLFEVIRRPDPRRQDVLRFLEASFNGARVAFATRLAISKADRDRSTDFYVLWRGRYFLASTGPRATSRGSAPAYAGSSRNGARVFFKTEERLLRADRDRIQDLYGRWSGRTRLVSR